MMLKIRDSLQRLHSSAVFQSSAELCSSDVCELVELNAESKQQEMHLYKIIYNQIIFLTSYVKRKKRNLMSKKRDINYYKLHKLLK